VKKLSKLEYLPSELKELGAEEVKEGILYKPVKTNFVAVDSFFKTEDGVVCGIQVTCAPNDDKSASVYQKLFEFFKLKDDSQFRLYFVVVPKMVEMYAKREQEKFIKTLKASETEKQKQKQKQTPKASETEKTFPNLSFHVLRCDEEFRIENCSRANLDVFNSKYKNLSS